MKISKQSAFTLIELLVVISIIAILASIAVPVFGKAQESAARTKALSNGKQIGYACRLFAQDYNGNFPQYKDPALKTGDPGTSNEIFRTLVPDYCTDENIFTIPKSQWSKKGADGDTSGQKALASGENAWSYLTGLSDTSNARWPLVVTAPSQDGKTYTKDEGKKGGLWRGEYAVVVRCDVSASADKTVKRGDSTYIKRDDNPSANALEPDPNGTVVWLSSDTKVLLPD